MRHGPALQDVSRGPLSAHYCHSRAEPNFALDPTERLERRLIQSRRSLTRISLAATPKHLRPRQPCIGPVPRQCLGPVRLADRSFSRRYEISYRGVKLPRVSAASGPFYLRREPDLPQADHIADDKNDTTSPPALTPPAKAT